LAFLLAPRSQTAPEYDRASDLMIEIVSPSDSASDLVDKVEFYIQNGVKSVWVVDPRKQRVDIYKPGRPARRVDAGDVLSDEVLPGFEFPLADFPPIDPSQAKSRAVTMRFSVMAISIA
jgi:Uma2 family endonuclease